MKKLALTIVCAVAVTGAAFGQGLVSFSPTRTVITFETNSTVFSPLFGGGAAGGAIGVVGNPAVGSVTAGLQYDFTLLYQTQTGYQVLATDTSVWDGTWKDTGLTATNSSSFPQSGTIASAVPSAASVPWTTGTTNSIILVGWSVNLGTTWAAVSNVLANWSADKGTIVGNAFFGESAFGYLTPATSPTPGIAIFATSDSGSGLPISGLNTQLYLLPVPEPATLALAGLGGLGLLLFRRRRQ
jgi:hypothetical protein